MRLLRVGLMQKSGAHDVNGEKVLVIITFFDQFGDSGVAVPTRVNTTAAEPLRLQNQEWKDNELHVLTASYLVPKGFREKEKEALGRSMKYYGYVVRVYYEGELQEVRARPAELAERI